MFEPTAHSSKALPTNVVLAQQQQPMHQPHQQPHQHCWQLPRPVSSSLSRSSARPCHNNNGLSVYCFFVPVCSLFHYYTYTYIFPLLYYYTTQASIGLDGAPVVCCRRFAVPPSCTRKCSRNSGQLSCFTLPHARRGPALRPALLIVQSAHFA